MSDITIEAEAYNEVFTSMFTNEERYQIYMGGAGSGKSSHIIMCLVLWMIEGRNILVIRDTLTSITDSTWAELQSFIYEQDLEVFFKFNETKKRITCTNGNRGMLVAKGLDKVERLKSIKFNKPIDTVFVEEATEIQEPDFNQLLSRQRGLTKFPIRVILAFNPVMKTHWIYKRFFLPIEDVYEGKGEYRGVIEVPIDDEVFEEGLYILHTTYKDNKFVGQKAKITYEGMKDIDPYHYQVYTLGDWGVLGDRVFYSVEEKDVTLDDHPNLPVYVGGDLGWSDPNAIIVIQYDKVNQTIYILDEWYKRKSLPDDMYTNTLDLLRRNNLHDKKLIVFDSNEPRAVEQIKNMGINAREAIKGGGSVLRGILWLKQHKIVVSPKCKHTIEELLNVTWVKDKKTNESTDEIDHNYSHTIAALRYGTEMIWSGTGKIAGYSHKKR